MGVLAGIGAATGALKPAQAIGLGVGGLAGLATSSFTPPKPPPMPTPPSLSQMLRPPGPLIGIGEGTAGGTFMGNNRAPQVSGGKKTLLGQ